MSKYKNLVRHLMNLDAEAVEYTFDEMKKILGFSLPDSSRIFRPWWANDKTHVQARDGWLKAGWDVTFVDLNEKIVRFGKKKNFTPTGPVTPTRQVSLEEINPADFENMAREVMSEHFNKELFEGEIKDVPKLFDLVSQDQKIVGDAKYFTMIRGVAIPPAKFATIAEYVWLLEKTNAERKFLVFGKDRQVPEKWLKRYGHLAENVEFYFLDCTTKKLERLPQ